MHTYNIIQVHHYIHPNIKNDTISPVLLCIIICNLWFYLTHLHSNCICIYIYRYVIMIDNAKRKQWYGGNTTWHRDIQSRTLM